MEDDLEVPVSVEDTNILRRYLVKVTEHIGTIKKDLNFSSNRKVNKLTIQTEDKDLKEIISTINEIIEVLRLD